MDKRRLNTKEELLELLKRYSGILTKPMMDYLNSLIELEFSVVREYIREDERKSLAELEIYKRIAIYNIYNRILNLLNEKKIKFNFENDYRLSISTHINKENVNLVDFYYKGFHPNEKIQEEYITMEIGTISLYQTLENQELREAELNRVMNQLERVWDAQNPYSSCRGVFGGPSSQWIFRHHQEKEEYEALFTELDNRKELNDMDKREIEITNQVRNLLLDDYDLTDESFEEIKSDYTRSLLKKNAC